MVNNKFDVVLDNLKKINVSKGFVTNDDILIQLSNNGLPIWDVDTIINEVYSLGIKIQNVSFEPNINKSPNFSFDVINISIGTKLYFIKDSSKMCTVKSSKTVDYDGIEYSLSGLALKLLRELGYNWTSVRGPSFFYRFSPDKTLDIEFKERNNTNALNLKREVTITNTNIDITMFGEDDWRLVKQFALSHDCLTKMENGVLAYFFKNKYVSDKQAKVLLNLLDKVKKLGFNTNKNNIEITPKKISEISNSCIINKGLLKTHLLTFTKPDSIVLGEVVEKVSSWKDVLPKVIQYVLKNNINNFTKLLYNGKFNSIVSKDFNSRWFAYKEVEVDNRKLYINVHGSAEDLGKKVNLVLYYFNMEDKFQCSYYKVVNVF